MMRTDDDDYVEDGLACMSHNNTHWRKQKQDMSSPKRSQQAMFRAAIRSEGDVSVSTFVLLALRKKTQKSVCPAFEALMPLPSVS